MEAIIRDGLPHAAFRFQATLSNGTRPDCLIKLPDSELRLIIDAKFPLEAFNALKEARGDAEMRQAEQRLRSDVVQARQGHRPEVSHRRRDARDGDHVRAVGIGLCRPLRAVRGRHPEIAPGAGDHRFAQRAHAAHPDHAGDLQGRADARAGRPDPGRGGAAHGRRDAHAQPHPRPAAAFRPAVQDVDKLVISTDKITKRGDRITQLDLSEPHDRPGEDQKTLPKIVAGIEHEARRP